MIFPPCGILEITSGQHTSRQKVFYLAPTFLLSPVLAVAVVFPFEGVFFFILSALPDETFLAALLAFAAPFFIKTDVALKQSSPGFTEAEGTHDAGVFDRKRAGLR